MPNYRFLFRFYAERLGLTRLTRIAIVWTLRLMLFGVCVHILAQYLHPDAPRYVSTNTWVLLVWAVLSMGWKSWELRRLNAISHEYVAVAVKKILFTIVLLFAIHAGP